MTSLKAIFIEAQDTKNQRKLVQAFSKIYENIPFDEFLAEFWHFCKHLLVVFEREPAVEKTIEFVSKAVTELALQAAKDNKAKKALDTGENVYDEEEMHPLLLRFFEFLLKVHSAKERAIRFRVCQLVSRLLQNLGEGALIDDTLYDQIYQSMLERLRDKCPAVRVHAVLALARLQDPTEETCPIIKAYTILLSRDPNAEVRRIILTCIAPSPITLPAILDRTHDVKDAVRNTAYSVISEKIPLKVLKIEQRIQLLQDGLSDRSELVRTTCGKKLLPAWLAECEGSVVELLDRLDVQSSIKTSEKVLESLMKSSGILDLAENFDLLNDKCVIDEDKLTGEKAFYWCCLVQFIHKAGHSFDEQLDMVRPNCLEFCSYVQNFAKKLIDCKDVDEVLDLEFTMQQLLKILCHMDLSDQASRKAMQSVLHDLMLQETVGPALTSQIMTCLTLVFTDANELTSVMAETISDIREPITTVEKQLTEEEQRELAKKVASVKTKLNELREELDGCIQRQDFTRAAELKANIAEMDLERSSFLESLQPTTEEIRTQKNDPWTLLKCLTMLCELLSLANIKSMSPILQTLMEREILPGMTNEEAQVRNMAIKAIGLCCLIKKEIIMQHLPLLLQASQIDVSLVQATALKATFDLVHVYGIEAFNDCETEDSQNQTTGQNETSESNGKDDTDPEMSANLSSNNQDHSGGNDKKELSHAANGVTTVLSAALDSECSDIRNVAAEGFAKLLMSGRLISSKLLSHLLLMWYNPLNEDDTTLLQCLGVFFPMFAFSSSSNQQLVEETFLPTLYTILRAPSTSPLAEVNELNVANFMIKLTDSNYLVDNQKSGASGVENQYHDSLALKICNEILSNPESFSVKFWLKVLGQLYITTDNLTLLKDLHRMYENMSMVITEKQSSKILRQMTENLVALKEEAEENQKLSAGEAVSEDQNSSTENTENSSGDSNNHSVSICPDEALDSNVSIAASGLKTPAVPNSARAAKGKSTMRTTRSRAASNFDNNMVTPVTGRKARVTSTDVEDARVDLENLRMSVSKTPLTVGKTPKRPLHSIQDPSIGN